MFSFSRRSYEAILKILAVFSSIVMMFISAQFSVDGFAFQNPNKMYIGWMLAIILIIVEMIFNNGVASVEDAKDAQEVRRNTILLVAGLVAYAYGIATNISGILHSGRMPDSYIDYIVPIALGLFLEIVPEPLMVWALLTPNSSYGGYSKKQEKKWQPPQQNFRPIIPEEIIKQQKRTYAKDE
jgi:hypothetical protein